jgi:hypothetical protein
MIYEYGEPQWEDTDRGKPKNLDKKRLSANLSNTNSTWSDLGINPGLCNERAVTNHLSHAMTF